MPGLSVANFNQTAIVCCGAEERHTCRGWSEQRSADGLRHRAGASVSTLTTLPLPALEPSVRISRAGLLTSRMTAKTLGMCKARELTSPAENPSWHSRPRDSARPHSAQREWRAPPEHPKCPASSASSQCRTLSSPNGEHGFQWLETVVPRELMISRMRTITTCYDVATAADCFVFGSYGDFENRSLRRRSLGACCKSASLGVESRFWTFLDVERAPQGSIAPFSGRFSVILRYLSVDTAGPRDGSDFCNRLLGRAGSVIWTLDFREIQGSQMLIRWILSAVGRLQDSPTSPVSNPARKRSPNTEPGPKTNLNQPLADDGTTGEVPADETLLERLRAAVPDDVLTVEVDELERTLEEHAAYSELFKDQADAEDAENARADLQAVAQAVADGDLSRVYHTVDAKNPDSAAKLSSPSRPCSPRLIRRLTASSCRIST